MAKKKKKLRIRRIIIALVLLGLFIFGLVKLTKGLFEKAKEIVDKGETAYLCSLDYEVQLYDMNFK